LRRAVVARAECAGAFSTPEFLEYDLNGTEARTWNLKCDFAR
jgi:hypothetical protein